MPTEVVLKCLSLREHRLSIDLVRDEVEAELFTVYIDVDVVIALIEMLLKYYIRCRNWKCWMAFRAYYTRRLLKPLKSSVSYRTAGSSSVLTWMTSVQH